MKYRVVWTDCEDERTGTAFEVEASDPRDAYHLAEEHIRGLSLYLRDHFCGLDLECLVDADGVYHQPDLFLKEK